MKCHHSCVCFRVSPPKSTQADRNQHQVTNGSCFQDILCYCQRIGEVFRQETKKAQPETLNVTLTTKNSGIVGDI